MHGRRFFASPTSSRKSFPTYSLRFLTRLIAYVKRGDFAARERLKMSDQKKDEELDNVSGGVGTHPIPIDPIRPPAPPTHPGREPQDPITRPNNPVGG
jgi:hypothetical protein